ncbi:hypothetical protein [Halobaculum lipolyticum]|uniref:ArsR family transcriptional regulator n=1 Tax=Halobaculum lipolyticum TaxID=3032001 RepID=A0ABD5WB72_9EURY|nr:hypothetical protein [Halobaculum sp. DT31]
MNGAREFVRAVAVSQANDSRVDLATLALETAGGASATQLITTHNVSRETVYRRLGELEDLGFVESNSGDGFQITRPGWLAFRAYERVSTRLGIEMLAYLAGSPTRRELIRALARAPADKATLAADPSLPSRATIHRILADFETYGWLVDAPDRRYHVSETAVLALEQVNWLYTAVTEAIDKGPALRAMAHWANPQLHTLVDSDLLTKTPGMQNTMVNAVVGASGLRTGEFERLRAVVPSLDRVTFERFEPSLTSARFQLVLDRPTFRHLARPQTHHQLSALLSAPTVELRVHRDPLSTVLAIFNDEQILIGGSTRTGRSDAVLGDTWRLNRWAMTTFEELWNESRPVESRFYSWLTAPPQSSPE